MKIYVLRPSASSPSPLGAHPKGLFTVPLAENGPWLRAQTLSPMLKFQSQGLLVVSENCMFFSLHFSLPQSFYVVVEDKLNAESKALSTLLDT